MAHPRVPHPYAITLIVVRSLILGLTLANLGAAAYMAAEYRQKQSYGIGIAVVCAVAIFVDLHPLVALTDKTRKIRRPGTAVTACFDLLLVIALVIAAILLLLSDWSYHAGAEERGEPPWFRVMGIVLMLTFAHMGCRFVLILWACVYGCVASHRKKKAKRRSQQQSGHEHGDTYALSSGSKAQPT